MKRYWKIPCGSYFKHPRPPPCLFLGNQLLLHGAEPDLQTNPPSSPGDAEGQAVSMGSLVERQAHPCEEQRREEGEGLLL